MVDIILRPHSASSHHAFDLLVLHVRTAMAQPRCFASIGPSLCNTLSPSVRSTFLSLLPLLFSKPALSRGSLHARSASEQLTLLEALYKYCYTIKKITRTLLRQVYFLQLN